VPELVNGRGPVGLDRGGRRLGDEDEGMGDPFAYENQKKRGKIQFGTLMRMNLSPEFHGQELSRDRGTPNEI
jgi:hypothetical protein